MLSLCSFPGCKMGANYSSLCLTGSWRLTPYRGRKIPPPPTQLVKKPPEKKKTNEESWYSDSGRK